MYININVHIDRERPSGVGRTLVPSLQTAEEGEGAAAVRWQALARALLRSCQTSSPLLSKIRVWRWGFFWATKLVIVISKSN